MRFLIDLTIIWIFFSVIYYIVQSLVDWIMNKFKTRYFMVCIETEDDYKATVYWTGKGYPDKLHLFHHIMMNLEEEINLDDFIVNNIYEFPNKKAYDLFKNPVIYEKSDISDTDILVDNFMKANEDELIKEYENKNEKPN